MVSSSQAALPWLDRSVTAAGPAQTLKASSPEGPRFHPFGEDGLSFLDLVDVVNPLHHIPVVGPMYREITGDVINPLPRITGSTLFFGPIGAGLAAADVVLEETTGQDTGEHILAMLRNPATTQTAEISPAQKFGANNSNPVDDWLQAETIYRKQFAAAQKATAATSKPAMSVPTKTTTTNDPVLGWAQAENAYRTGLATRQNTNTLVKSLRSEQTGGVNITISALALYDKNKIEAPPQKHRTVLN